MLLWLLAALQLLLGVRVVLRFIRSAGGVRIKTAKTLGFERVSVIVPVLNEWSRIEACLDGLIGQSEAAAEILVVDGSSSDGTQSIVERYGSRDRRVRLIDASPVPSDCTGKAWGLCVGLKNSDPRSKWVLCVDADVRCSPLLVSSLLAHAEGTGFQLSRLPPASTFQIGRTRCSIQASWLPWSIALASREKPPATCIRFNRTDSVFLAHETFC